jgi:hypothetical protein
LRSQSFSPKSSNFDFAKASVEAKSGKESSTHNELDLSVTQRTKPVDSEFLKFLKSGLVSLENALDVCEHRDPPLYAEMIYILSQIGSKRRALHLLLTVVGKPDYFFCNDFILHSFSIR